MLLFFTAAASEVTAFPEPLGGRLAITYRGTFETGKLLEDEVVVSKREIQEHNIDASVELSPFKGVALTLGLEATPTWRWRYPEARTMLLEPVDGGGSYRFGDSDTEGVYERQGGGLTGVWIGAAVSPFSEQLFPKQRASWRLDVAIRPGNKKSNRWTVQNGKRGASPGSTGVRVVGAFSTRSGIAEPYIRAMYRHEGRVTIALADEDGLRVTDFVVNPGSTIEVIGGTGVLPNDTDSGSAFDIHLGAVYKTWEDLPAGMLLPHVIDSAKSVPATHSESFTGLFGMGVDLGFNKHIGASLGGRFSYTLPHRQEHLFDVTTSPDTFGVHGYVTLRAKVSKSDLD